jgi:predicted ATP-grasp superfamily ATP-dependent carboligase
MLELIIMKVLLTDGECKHTLAATRALGRKNVDVSIISTKPRCLSFHSKYCRKEFICSNLSTKQFVIELSTILKNEKFDVLLPISYHSCLSISKNIDLLRRYTKIPLASSKSMNIASDKNETVQFAIKNKIPVPKTFTINEINEVEEISQELQYPVVIKALEESGSVKYANSKDELINLYKKECQTFKSQTERGKFPQIQEYIPGDGYGFYALFNHGEPRAFFMHKRIHEFPITGGPSTMAKSYFNSELKELGLKVLEKLNWHGVAMVEFKKDRRDGKFKLIEINPKFWGSLDLSISAGVNFPYLACKMCVEGDIEPVFEYNENIYFRWVLPDFRYAVSYGYLLEFIHNFTKKHIYHDIQFHDIKPFIYQLKQIPIMYSNSLKESKYLHGLPKT